MRRNSLMLIFLLSTMFSYANDIETIKNRIAQWHWTYGVTTDKVLKNALLWKQTLKENNQWEAVDYTNPTRTTWTAFVHLRHVEDMVIAYTAPWSSLKNEAGLHQAIVRSLSYWNKAKLTNINWWWNEIAAPRTLGVILIMLDQAKVKPIPGELRSQLIAQMHYPRKYGVTGVNLADFDTHLFYSGLLTANEQEIRGALHNIFKINKKTVREGVQYDDSYAQHEIMLHVFGYGTEYLKVETYIAATVANTKFAMKGKELKVFTDFITKTLIPMIRGKHANHLAMGRQIARKGYTNMQWLAPYFKQLIAIDPENKTIYRDAIARLNGLEASSYHVAAFQKHYWNTDFGFFQNKEYQFAVRLSSVFTEHAETDLNGENTKGGYRSVGHYAVLQEGDEYYNIYPLWDWKKLPGTTVVEAAAVPNTDYLTPGKSTFAGGVSNGKIGVTAYKQNEFKIAAKKSWFMWEDAIVCIEGGINTTAQDSAVVTTVEQNFLEGKVEVKYKNSDDLKNLTVGSNKRYHKPLTILHNQVAYVFPKRERLHLTLTEEMGNWHQLRSLESTEMVQGEVFKLWINHGKNPKNEAYAYFIIPGVKTPEKAENIAARYKVINTENVQGVYDTKTHRLMLVFFNPDKIRLRGHTYQADKPCVLLIEANKAFVSDPSRKLQTLTITIDDKERKINLPQEKGFLGSSVSFSK